MNATRVAPSLQSYPLPKRTIRAGVRRPVWGPNLGFARGGRTACCSSSSQRRPLARRPNAGARASNFQNRGASACTQACRQAMCILRAPWSALRTTHLNMASTPCPPSPDRASHARAQAKEPSAGSTASRKPASSSMRPEDRRVSATHRSGASGTQEQASGRCILARRSFC